MLAGLQVLHKYASNTVILTLMLTHYLILITFNKSQQLKGNSVKREENSYRIR